MDSTNTAQKWPSCTQSHYSRMMFFAAVALYFFKVLTSILSWSERDNRFVRFHATQSILFFGTMSLLEWVCSYFPFALFGLGGIVGLVSFIGWIVLMVVAHRGWYYKLPLFGDLAEQLASRMTI